MDYTLIAPDATLHPGLPGWSVVGNLSDDQLGMYPALVSSASDMHNALRGEVVTDSGLRDAKGDVPVETETDRPHMVISATHFPAGVWGMAEGMDFLSSLGDDHMMHLSGHCHNRLWSARLGRDGPLDLEVASVYYNRVYRIFTLDHGFLNAVDLPLTGSIVNTTLSEYPPASEYDDDYSFPIVAPTMPPHASLLHRSQPLGSLADVPIRVLVFSTPDSTPVRVYVDVDYGVAQYDLTMDVSRPSRAVDGERQVSEGPATAYLYTSEWDCSPFLTGIHSMKVYAEVEVEDHGETVRVRREVEYPFSLDGTAPQPIGWRKALSKLPDNRIQSSTDSNTLASDGVDVYLTEKSLDATLMWAFLAILDTVTVLTWTVPVVLLALGVPLVVNMVRDRQSRGSSLNPYVSIAEESSADVVEETAPGAQLLSGEAETHTASQPKPSLQWVTPSLTRHSHLPRSLFWVAAWPVLLPLTYGISTYDRLHTPIVTWWLRVYYDGNLRPNGAVGFYFGLQWLIFIGSVMCLLLSLSPSAPLDPVSDNQPLHPILVLKRYWASLGSHGGKSIAGERVRAGLRVFGLLFWGFATYFCYTLLIQLLSMHNTSLWFAVSPIGLPLVSYVGWCVYRQTSLGLRSLSQSLDMDRK
ncbi:hypothetical protein KIPB_007089 [Kipferlia bialata]|uniref:Uncharacterized protein n=2 Tax=Kipferlia bialata TaxID=797122 RepID=A0A9K3CY73_9EUKA|nr:hypothetical protein KIPB_007089 [Kipferlia bialata]|eukprot:g7089.t1